MTVFCVTIVIAPQQDITNIRLNFSGISLHLREVYVSIAPSQLHWDSFKPDLFRYVNLGSATLTVELVRFMGLIRSTILQVRKTKVVLYVLTIPVVRGPLWLV